jgi:hypothetical protein
MASSSHAISGALELVRSLARRVAGRPPLARLQLGVHDRLAGHGGGSVRHRRCPDPPRRDGADRVNREPRSLGRVN